MTDDRKTMSPIDAQIQVAGFVRRYLIAEQEAPSGDWRRVDDGAHLSGMSRILDTLEGPRLPGLGDPLAVAELAWRAVHAKHRAFSRYESIHIDSPDMLEKMAAVMRRWPTIRFERGNFGELCPQQYRSCVELALQLERQDAVALDGVRAKLRYELEMRDIWEESEVIRRGTSRDLLERALDLLDQACPDPMLQIGYQVAEARRDSRATRLAQLERRAEQLHATSLEGAMVHVMLALSQLDRLEDSQSPAACRRHLSRACRTLEAHTGMIVEELGGTAPEREPLAGQAPGALRMLERRMEPQS